MSLMPVALPLISHPNVACQSNGYTLNRERPENQPAKATTLTRRSAIAAWSGSLIKLPIGPVRTIR